MVRVVRGQGVRRGHCSSSCPPVQASGGSSKRGCQLSWSERGPGRMRTAKPLLRRRPPVTEKQRFRPSRQLQQTARLRPLRPLPTCAVGACSVLWVHGDRAPGGAFEKVEGGGRSSRVGGGRCVRGGGSAAQADRLGILSGTRQVRREVALENKQGGVA